MSVTAYKSSGTQVNVERGSFTPWFDPTDAAASDDIRVSAPLEKDDGQSDWLRLTNFGFTSGDVPAGANIDGIEVSIERQSGEELDVSDEYIKLRDSAATQQGDNKASATGWSTDIDETIVYGGAADTWNAGLDQADIISSNFGIDIAAINTDSIAREARVDHVKIRVYYTEATPTASPIAHILQMI